MFFLHSAFVIQYLQHHFVDKYDPVITTNNLTLLNFLVWFFKLFIPSLYLTFILNFGFLSLLCNPITLFFFKSLYYHFNFFLNHSFLTFFYFSFVMTNYFSFLNFHLSYDNEFVLSFSFFLFCLSKSFSFFFFKFLYFRFCLLFLLNSNE